MANGRWFNGQWNKGWKILPPSGRHPTVTAQFQAARFLTIRLRMESRIIRERAFRFACRTVKLCERLWTQGPAARKIADQLFRSGTSIGANTAES
jgi:hypothetical protein